MTNFDNRNIRNQPASTNPNSDQTQLSTNAVEGRSLSSQTAYHNGYEQGRYAENRANETLRAREDENAANGILFGLLLASLVGLGAGAFYFLNEQNRAPRDVTPNVVVPKPSPSQRPEVRERVVERERVVPVPQQAPQAPEVNITVPNPTSETQTTQPAPQTEPQTATQSSQNNAPASSSGNSN